jgi:hypothetical protein
MFSIITNFFIICICSYGESEEELPLNSLFEEKKERVPLQRHELPLPLPIPTRAQYHAALLKATPLATDLFAMIIDYTRVIIIDKEVLYYFCSF